MQHKYLLLLHDTVRSYLSSLGNSAKQHMREKLRFLQNGMWDTGVRVKKLKGGRSIFEARLTRGDRILFTMGRSSSAASASSATTTTTRIYVWSVVNHDDVGAVKKRISPANAPFLDFQPDTVQQLPDLVVDDLPDEYFCASFEQLKTTTGDLIRMNRTEMDRSHHAGPQHWMVVDDEEWRRLLTAKDPDNLQLYLFLTGEQAQLLTRDPPVLLSGTAGSGKTTLAIYYLLRHRARQLIGGAAGADDAVGTDGATNPESAAPAQAHEKMLFVTCSPHLKDSSERLYRGLVAETDREAAPDAVRFTTFDDLLRDILPSGRKGLVPGHSSGLREFCSIVHSHPQAGRYDSELVWEEIRSVIKGSKPPISRRRFQELAKRLADRQASAHNRAEIAEYVARLANLELGNRLEAMCKHKTSFANLQEFIASLRETTSIRQADQIVLLDEALYLLDAVEQRYIEQPLLTLREYEGISRKRAPNFSFDRRGIYRIAKYYQERLEQTERYDEIDLTRAALRHLEQCEDRYRYDLVVCDEVQDLTDMQIALLFALAADPQRTVLAGDPKQIINPSGFRWEEVRARYYERGLPVPEVVDLSVNFRSAGNIVDLANGLIALKKSLIGLVSGEITEHWTFRGRPPLLVDGVSERELLSAIQLGGAGQVVLVRTAAERDRLRAALNTALVFTIHDAKGLEFDTVLLWRFTSNNSSAETWRRIAQKLPHAAADRPHIRHELSLLYVAVTRARNTLVIWDGPDANAIWKMDQLSDHVFRSGDTAALTTLWQRVSTPEEWEIQGDYFLDKKHFSAAQECFRNAQEHTKEALVQAFQMELEGNYREAADLFARHGQVKRAALNLEQHEALIEAARAWRQAGDELRAVTCEAQHFESIGRYVKAASCWRHLGDTERMVHNWKQAGEHRMLSEHYLSQDRADQAARHLRLAGSHAESAVQFRRAGLLAEAAQELETAKNYIKAITLYRILRDLEGLLRCYLKIEDFHNAALLYEKQLDLDRAIDCFRSYAQSSENNRQDLERRLAVISPKRPGLKAAVRMVALGRVREAACIFERKKGHLPRAITLYQTAGAHAEAAACLSRDGQYREAALQILLSGEPTNVRQAVKHLSSFVLEDRNERVKRVDQLSRSGRRLHAAGKHAYALAHFLALQDVCEQSSKVAETYVDDVCKAYAELHRDEEAIRYFLGHDRAVHAAAYLIRRPELVLSLQAIEEMVVDKPRLSIRHLWKMPNAHRHVLIRLLQASLYRGEEPDRHERIASILVTLPRYYAASSAVFEELGVMLIELRLYNPIAAIVDAFRHGVPHPERHKLLISFCDRLKSVADSTGDRELILCSILTDHHQLEAGLPEIKPTPQNYMLFALSPAYYLVAVELMVNIDEIEEAALTCRSYGDYERAGTIHEEAGDLKEAAQEYREAGQFEDARRCYQRLGDEVGLARTYEREERYSDALAIWHRLDRTREIAQVSKKLDQA